MTKRITLFLMMIFFISIANAQLKSPAQFLGYELGQRFTPYHQVLAYFDHVAANSSIVKLEEYGKTYENRPLRLAYVASPENFGRLEEIRLNNLKLAGIESGQGSTDQPVIVWLSYNVHGNESVSTEAVLQTIYELVNPANSTTKEWLKNTVVIIDPCLNPDGRERYVNFYTERVGKNFNAAPYTREHLEPWPGGRPNHYLFDLNRDWAWQSQIETQQRIKVYNQWLPQVHVDFHEMGIDEPYYFAPAAEPFHEDITAWQREFQVLIGKNNAKYFDKNNWLYFTKEIFDLLYPSYGDTYPTFSGAIGMTYEQGGSGRAGLAVVTATGDSLTLKDRIDHHHIAGLSTIEASSINATRAVTEFRNYFTKSKSNPAGIYKTYVIRGDNPVNKLKDFAAFLDRNGIEYGYGTARGGLGFNYFTGREESFSAQANDLVISAFQPKSTLVKVLMEPTTVVPDSLTYDLTAWALPYAWGLKAFALRERINPSSTTLVSNNQPAITVDKPLAYIAPWTDLSSLKFLSALIKNKIRVRYSQLPFKVADASFGAGSLVLLRTDNVALGDNFDKTVQRLSANHGVSLAVSSTGFADAGPDFGSPSIRYINAPRVAVLAGDEVSSTSFGEVWHYFDQQIDYPIDVVETRHFNRIDLKNTDVIILPNGFYNDLMSENQLNKLKDWVRAGGKLIAMGNTVSQLADKPGFLLKFKEEDKKDDKKNPDLDLKTFAERDREGIKSEIPGSIFRVQLDNTHPLAFGYGKDYFTLKFDSRMYAYLPDGGWNVGVIRKNALVSGFVGSNVKAKMQDGLVFGVQELGSGSVVYMADNPLFRSFWENGKLLFGNAIFLVGQ